MAKRKAKRKSAKKKSVKVSKSLRASKSKIHKRLKQLDGLIRKHELMISSFRREREYLSKNH